MTIAENFRRSIESYLDASHMLPTTFGKVVMNDPNFVFDIRDGRSPNAETMDRVLGWIDANRVRGDAAE